MNICVAAGLVKVNFKNKSILKLTGIAIFHPILYFVGETYGITMTTASKSSAIIASLPLVTILLSAIIMKKLPAKHQALGVGITFTGIIIINMSKGIEVVLNPWGYLALFLAIVSYSLYSVFAEMSTEFSSTEKTYAMISLGFITFTSIAIYTTPRLGVSQNLYFYPLQTWTFL